MEGIRSFNTARPRVLASLSRSRLASTAAAIGSMRKRLLLIWQLTQHRSFISDLENGKKEICLRNLEVVAIAFGLTPAQLLSRL
jgi:hypothetical protein